VEEGLAACAQVAGPITSTYRWEGRVETAEEWYCHLKTSAELLPDAMGRVRALHPYDVPEIIALPILGGDPDYLRWVGASVTRPPGSDA
jgi:periplasmic divalent cation tolerance protein